MIRKEIQQELDEFEQFSNYYRDTPSLQLIVDNYAKAMHFSNFLIILNSFRSAMSLTILMSMISLLIRLS